MFQEHGLPPGVQGAGFLVVDVREAPWALVSWGGVPEFRELGFYGFSLENPKP